MDLLAMRALRPDEVTSYGNALSPVRPDRRDSTVLRTYTWSTADILRALHAQTRSFFSSSGFSVSPNGIEENQARFYHLSVSLGEHTVIGLGRMRVDFPYYRMSNTIIYDLDEQYMLLKHSQHTYSAVPRITISATMDSDNDHRNSEILVKAFHNLDAIVHRHNYITRTIGVPENVGARK